MTLDLTREETRKNPEQDSRSLRSTEKPGEGRQIQPAVVGAEPLSETQKTISAWATETFGPVGTNVRVAIRANEEMAELLRALSVDDNSPKAAEEIADILIVLYRVAERLGCDLLAEVDRKMAVNRLRKWNRDGSGHGYHVRDKWRDEEVAVLAKAGA
jgi:NTP pyrophosphatase (non-canonical NTP hydrolase)